MCSFAVSTPRAFDAERKTRNLAFDNRWESGYLPRSIFWKQNGDFTMSMHSSLKSAAKIRTSRNVLKRFERVDILKKKGKWKAGDRAHGLPKTKPEQ
jgi:small basic protein (TIGR04137 family)